jgi:hypothetical protein
MDDSTAFERQVARRFQHHAGPVRPVDDAAIFTAITATQSPKWRFGSVFSATKFVVAGAIVALFGGFLLSTVLTQPPSDEPLPAVGASASAQAEPTGATTSAPEPTADAEAESTTTTTDLVPGVDLVTEEVRPGIYRVLSDGERDLRSNVWDVSVTSEGDVWVEEHRVTYDRGAANKVRYQDARVLRLGDPKVRFLAPDKKDKAGGYRIFLDLENGDPVVEGGTVKRRVWRDGAWYWGAPTCYQGMLIGTDVCWNRWDWDGDAVQRDDYAAPSREDFTTDDVGLDPDDFFGTRFAAGPDGTIWTDTYDGRPSYQRGGDTVFTGLASYDGQSWTTTDYTQRAMDFTESLAVAPDGTVWVAGWKLGPDGADQHVFVRWDGEDWETYELVDPPPVSQLDIQFAPDGRVWFNPLTYHDGSGIRRLEFPGSVATGELRVGEYSYAPDGSVWAVLIDMQSPQELGCQDDPGRCEGVPTLYVITPEAVAAVE